MAFTENLDEFFNLDTPGSRTATYGAASPVVLFDNAYIELDGSIESRAPMIMVKESDFPTVAHGATLTISAIVYKVIGVEPDGHGVVRLMLERQ